MRNLEKLNGFVGVINVFTLDCQQINFIDTPKNRIEFTTSSPMNSGWDGEWETIENIEPLDEFIGNMDINDFNELLDKIDCAR